MIPILASRRLPHLIKQFRRCLSSQDLVRDLKGPIPDVINIQEIENKWSDILRSSHKSSQHNGAIFSMVLPPPNVTGSLHLGHALTVSIQDTICRLKQMEGKEVVWIPGFDHAGIATQAVLEKQIWDKHQKTRHDLGKDVFLGEAADWKNSKISEMRNQIQRLAAGTATDKEYFTMDQAHSYAVNEAFIRLFNAGHIYRANRHVHWCSKLQSTLSDMEVDWKKLNGPTKIKLPSGEYEFGIMHRIAYPVEDSTEQVIICTTRIESLPGDVAVAVHPNDQRYIHLVGKRLKHPLTQELIPIIADEAVDPNLGTGALKITPGHSAIDYSIGQRHNLEVRNIYDSHGRISMPVNCENLNGIDRLEAKDAIKKILEAKGFYNGCFSHSTMIPLCSRTGDLVESAVMPQWYLTTKSVQQPLIDFIESNDQFIHQTGYRNTLLNWLKTRNQDWCISRQLWWGHRIPAYTTSSSLQSIDAKWTACHDSNAAKELLGHSEVYQDNDVLDTWFSSSLIPLTVAGWPQSDPKQSRLFPLTLMETGFDIIYFWVGRMLLMSKLLTGEIPFQQVLLHGMITDERGKKMSKSVGNVINPMDVIEGCDSKQLKLPACGADGLRLALLRDNFKKELIRISPESIVRSRNVLNKIFQTVRYSFVSLDRLQSGASIDYNFNVDNLQAMDKWILSRLASYMTCVEQAAQEGNYQFNDIIREFNNFWIESVCDIYLEWTKHHLHDPVEDLQRANLSLSILFYCLQNALISLHPIAPHITSELYNRIHFKLNPNSEDLQNLLSFPITGLRSVWSELRNDSLEHAAKQLDQIVGSLRGIYRTEFSTKENPLHVLFVHNVIHEKDSAFLDLLNSFTLLLRNAKVETYRFKSMANNQSAYDKEKFMVVNEIKLSEEKNQSNTENSDSSSLLVLIKADESQRNSFMARLKKRCDKLDEQMKKLATRKSESITTEEEIHRKRSEREDLERIIQRLVQ